MGSRCCLHCREFFLPSPNNRQKQRYCQKADCRKASKSAAQGKWLNKKANRRYFRGSENIERVRAWRKRNPGYWRRKSRSSPEENAQAQPVEKQAIESERNLVTHPLRQSGEEAGALQDFASIQVPMLLGLASVMAGDALQDHFAVFCGALVERGKRVLGAVPARADTT